MASPVPRRLVLAALPMLAGCMVVGPLDESMLASIRRGETAAVMLRFVVTNEAGEQVAPFSAGLSDDSLGLALGDFDSGGLPEPGRWPARSPGEAAQGEGLIVFLLAPGYYYLAIQGARRTDAFTYGARYRTVPRWRLAVPAGVPLLYAGTFLLKARSERLLFGDVVITAVDQEATAVVDETGWAQRAAARDLGGLPAPLTRLAVRHEGPVLLGTPPP
ncbi:hypothetical protein [Elioraea rosea]|uniref:hypothetical protein n=1 Tax=Elioraea rosea TaxID=2492390 RepID=UPI001181F290|nr:hypothetical protein [Elioraea rosea]